MKKFNKISIIILAVAFALSITGSARAATAVSLGTADGFAVLAGTGITFGGAVNTTNITGDIGSFSTPSITGIGNVVLNGTNHAGDAVTQGAKTDLTTAYLNAEGQSLPSVTTLTASSINSFNITGTTLTPGIYKSGSSIGLTGTLTLDGGGNANAVFIFQAGSTLTTAGASTVVLQNGTQACNVYWQVGSSATLGASSVLKGNILALTDIGLGTTANVIGRVLARNGAVTFDGSNTVTKATCAAATPATVTPSSGSNWNTITVVKQVINDNGGTAKFSDFPLFVNGNPIQSGESQRLSPGMYTVTETSRPGYTASFTGNCDANGRIDHGGVNTTNDLCVVVNDDNGAPAVAPVPPLIDVVKVPNLLALPAGPGAVTYTYTVRNVGTVPMTDVTMVGDTCSPIVRVSGDTNSDSKLDVNETWVYRCTTTLSETHTNTVVATGHANGLTAVDAASATVVVGLPIVPPLIHVTKVPSPLTLPAGAGKVTYTIKVTNPGTVRLSDVKVTDDKCGPVNYVSGNTNTDSYLDTNETWTYTCQANLTKTTTDTVTAVGSANGLTATDFALATVVVAVPKLPNTGVAPDQTNIRNIMMAIGILMLVSVSLGIALKKRKA